MSSAISTAIYRRLTGLESAGIDLKGLAAQQALAALLGVDPDTSLPSVHKGNKSEVVVYPAITFRPAAGMVNANFGTSGIAVDDPVYNFEIWDNTQRANIITDIYAQFEILLDDRFGVVQLPVDNAHGRVYHAEAFVPLIEEYDRDLRSWFGLCRMRFVEARF